MNLTTKTTKNINKQRMIGVNHAGIGISISLLLFGLVSASSAYSKDNQVKDQTDDQSHSATAVFDFAATYDTEQPTIEKQSNINQDAQDLQREKSQNKAILSYQDDINDLIFAIDNQEDLAKEQKMDEASDEKVVAPDDKQPQYQMIGQIQPHSEPEAPLYPTGECNPDALALGIEHFRYAEAPASDLVNIGGRRLHKDAASWLKQMQADAKQDKITLTVGSAFRSIRYQKGIISRKKRQGLTDEEIYSVSAPAGYSEHSTGYAVDFYPIDASFAKTKAYQWLLDNADQYGWTQSFTKEVSEQSNVMVEPWHWRFEGTPEAQQLFQPRSCYSTMPPADDAVDKGVIDTKADSAGIAKEDAEVIELERKDFALQEEWEEYQQNKHKDIVGD